MAGHNKWTQIKHKKAAVDAKKSKVFSMLAKILTVESKQTKGDRNNPNLRKAIDRAKEANMPNENIDRAIAKGIGAGQGELEEVTYEAYGPGGVAIIIEGITDNKNRTTPEIKHLLSEHEVTLGGQGSALWAFNKNSDGWEAKTLVEIGEADQKKLASLLEDLDDHEDIRNIFTNAQI